VIGTITTDIARTTNAAGESALGDVIADPQYGGSFSTRQRYLTESVLSDIAENPASIAYPLGSMIGLLERLKV
jgi:hypothetical protein